MTKESSMPYKGSDPAPRREQGDFIPGYGKIVRRTRHLGGWSYECHQKTRHGLAGGTFFEADVDPSAFRYTRDQLEASLRNLLGLKSSPDMVEAYIKSAGIPSACTHAAETCFLHMIEESEDTRILRKAIEDLRKFGAFKWEDA